MYAIGILLTPEKGYTHKNEIRTNKQKIMKNLTTERFLRLTTAKRLRTEQYADIIQSAES
jgi:hypothetical protein